MSSNRCYSIGSELDGLIDALGPNEFLGNYTFPIVTESGEEKLFR